IREARALPLPEWADLGTVAWPDRIHERVKERELLFRLQFMARMLYSCLVEADDRETARFYAEMEGREQEPENCCLDTGAMAAAFERYIAALGGDGSVNALRR